MLTCFSRTTDGGLFSCYKTSIQMAIVTVLSSFGAAMLSNREHKQQLLVTVQRLRHESSNKNWVGFQVCGFRPQVWKICPRKTNLPWSKVTEKRSPWRRPLICSTAQKIEGFPHEQNENKLRVTSQTKLTFKRTHSKIFLNATIFTINPSGKWKRKKYNPCRGVCAK